MKDAIAALGKGKREKPKLGPSHDFLKNVKVLEKFEKAESSGDAFQEKPARRSRQEPVQGERLGLHHSREGKTRRVKLDMKWSLPTVVCVALSAGCCRWCAAGEGSSMDANTEVVRGNNAFAVDLYGRVARGDGNRFLSPFSISCALAMTYGGARGDTAVQIANALQCKLPPDQLHPAFHRLIAELNHQNDSQPEPNAPRAVELLTANALWTQSGERILPEFQKLIEKSYGGGLFPVDFRHAPTAACEYINHWVEEQTRGRIKDLIKPNHIDSRTVLILTNAIYFKALWASPFPAQLTRPGDFQASSGEKVPVADDAPHREIRLRRRHRGPGARAALSGRESLHGRRLAQGPRRARRARVFAFARQA